MKTEFVRMNACKEDQRINVGGECRSEITADARFLSFVKFPSGAEVFLRFVEDLNPQGFFRSRRSFTSDQS